MISVVLYGRNDAHGYNLHRRAALSLNCLAEVLTDADDEIVFVDYNTPDELPTFVEALADTLTERCVSRMRVLRVRAALHDERYRALTHLPTVEAVARNAAVRRANPANPWLLSTNTDMVFVPLDDTSLSNVVRELPSAFYGLPRFELPEWLWELMPRTDPEHALAELRTVGPALRLDEHTLSDTWIRFDAPGDFQLMRRDDFVAIAGFNEEMFLGWHVDSNLSRRMMLHRGSIESLDERLAGYHCNHNRTPTVYHEAVGIANDLNRFYLEVDSAELLGQRETWGLADAELEEIPLGARARRRLVDALTATVSGSEAPRIVSSATDYIFALTYDSAHVLPFLADTIALAPRGATIGYVGANTTLEELLGRLIDNLAENRTLLSTTDDVSAEQVSESADILVVDFGLDSALVSADSIGRSDASGSRPYPTQLATVMTSFRKIVAAERARLDGDAHPRLFVLVNSTTGFADPYVTAHLDCSYTTPHSRIRRATVRLVPSEDERLIAAEQSAERLISWAGREAVTDTLLPLRVGRRLDVAALTDFWAFGEGWLFPEATAIWTRGTRAEITFALEVTRSDPYLFSILIGRVGAGRDELLSVDLLINDSWVDTRLFPGGAHASIWRVPVPADAVTTRVLNLRLEIREAGVWTQDERQLGLYVKGFLLEREGWRRRLADTLATLRRRAAPG